MKQNLKQMQDAKFEKGSQMGEENPMDSLNVNNLLTFRNQSKRGGDHLDIGFSRPSNNSFKSVGSRRRQMSSKQMPGLKEENGDEGTT